MVGGWQPTPLKHRSASIEGWFPIYRNIKSHAPNHQIENICGSFLVTKQEIYGHAPGEMEMSPVQHLLHSSCSWAQTDMEKDRKWCCGTFLWWQCHEFPCWLSRDKRFRLQVKIIVIQNNSWATCMVSTCQKKYAFAFFAKIYNSIFTLIFAETKTLCRYKTWHHM